MPLFFREEKKTELKNTCIDSGADDALNLVLANDESQPLSKSPSEQASDLPERGSTELPEVVPSRKSKPPNWTLRISVVVLVAPMVVLLLLTAFDSFTRDYVIARMHWVAKDFNGAIHYFSKALEVKPDTRALEVRADCYDATGDLQKERADLVRVVQLTDLKKAPTHWQVYKRYTRLAVLEARLGNLGEAKKLYELYATFPVGSKPDDRKYYALEAAYELLLLDDLSKCKTLVAETDPKPDMISKSLGVNNATRQVLQVLQYREDGDRERALEVIRLIGDKYTSTFRDSRVRTSNKDEAVGWSLEALICLDKREVEKARTLIQKAEAERGGRDKSKPIIDVLKAWMLLEEGDLDACLSLTQATLAEKELNNSSIEGLNLKAALHLIRKNAFKMQNQTKQAELEEQLYKQTYVSGRIFTPLCFRSDR